MKYGIMEKILGYYYIGISKKTLSKHVPRLKAAKKEIMSEYKKIVKRANEIGPNSPLLSSYLLGAYFIALTRKGGIDINTCCECLEQGFKKSKLIKLFVGTPKTYLNPKKLPARISRGKESQKRIYPNDWVYEYFESDDKYPLKFDYYECGICKLCKDEGCFELAKYLCRFDYLLLSIGKMNLDRTKTLANGDEKCDFRIYEDK